MSTAAQGPGTWDAQTGHEVKLYKLFIASVSSVIFW